jgi:hypothetical protein
MPDEPIKPAAKPQPPKNKPIEQKAARTLGRAFARIKHTRVWRDTDKAYHDELEGKKE